jgi:hypothetical protein
MDNRTEIRDFSVDYYSRLERGNLGGASDGAADRAHG